MVGGQLLTECNAREDPIFWAIFSERASGLDAIHEGGLIIQVVLILLSTASILAAGLLNPLAISEPPTTPLQKGEQRPDAFSNRPVWGKLANMRFVKTTSFSSCDEQNDAAEVAETMREFFDALARNNEEALENTITDDFLLFENGEVWSLQRLIREIFGSGERTWTLIDVAVIARGDIAHITYKNQGTFALGGKPIRRREYLESALLINTDGNWRIQFLHSTRLSDRSSDPSN